MDPVGLFRMPMDQVAVERSGDYDRSMKHEQPTDD